MFEFFGSLFGLSLLFYIGFRLTGAVLSALFWLTVKVPIALSLFGFGGLLCFTIIFFPWGVKCIKLSWAVLF